MSRYSHGVLAPELLNRPFSPGVSVSAVDDLLADSLQLPQAEVAAVFDDQLEPAGGAQAVDRRCAEDRDDGFADFCCGSASADSAAIASAVRSAPRRSSNGLSMTYIEPKIRRVGVQDQRLPGDADGVRDARRVAERIFSMRAIDCFGALDRRRIGQLHVEEQVAFVLLRNEAGRRAVELPSRLATSKPAIDEQRQIALIRSSPPTIRP